MASGRRRSTTVQNLRNNLQILTFSARCLFRIPPFSFGPNGRWNRLPYFLCQNDLTLTAESYPSRGTILPQSPSLAIPSSYLTRSQSLRPLTASEVTGTRRFIVEIPNWQLNRDDRTDALGTDDTHFAFVLIDNNIMHNGETRICQMPLVS